MRILVLALAGAAALAVAFFVSNTARKTNPDLPAPAEILANAEPEIRVLVADREIAFGARIAESDLSWKKFSAEAAGFGEGFIKETAEPEAMKQIAGQIARTAIGKGEPITPAKIVRPGDRGVMAAMVRAGMRAVAAAVSVDTAAGGFVNPQDRVDVILSRDLEITMGAQTRGRVVTDTIIENVRVLAVDQAFEPPKEPGATVGSTVTLELSPRDAELLVQAMKMGRIVLVLRGVEDLAADRTISRQGSPALASGAPSGLGPSTIRMHGFGSAGELPVGGLP
jgi:pilus assembly protein CpaB